MWIGQIITVCDNSYIRKLGVDDSKLVWKSSSKSWRDLYGQEVQVVSEPITILIEGFGNTCYGVKMFKVLTFDFDAYWVLFEGSKGNQLYHLPENPFKFFFIVEANNQEQYFPTIKEAVEALKLRKESGRASGSGRIYQAFFGHEGKTTLLLDSYGYDRDSQKFWQEDGSKTIL